MPELHSDHIKVNRFPESGTPGKAVGGRFSAQVDGACGKAFSNPYWRRLGEESQ
jgi:hypothetical protein